MDVEIKEILDSSKIETVVINNHNLTVSFDSIGFYDLKIIEKLNISRLIDCKI